MSEQKETTQEAADASAKKAPATFRTILSEKIGMTQVFGRKENLLFGVTVVKVGPCPVVQVKTEAGKDGYNAVKLAYGQRKEKNIPKPVLGQFKKAGAAPARWIKEIRVESTAGLEAGQSVTIDGVFKPGDYVDAQGTSKGKGFAGVMKRHNFKGLPASHGASDKQRSPGSLASRRSLGRVMPGQRMAGRMGGVTETVMKLEVIKVDAVNNLLYLNGSVPGPKHGFVTISETIKGPKARIDIVRSAIRKDKMGNIIKAPTKPGAVKK